MIPVLWHRHDARWASAMPRFILSGVSAFEIIGIENTHLDGAVAVIVLPGKDSCYDYAQINECAAKFEKIVFMVYDDEEGCFKTDELEHKNKIIWWSMPPFKRNVNRRTVIGWPIGAAAIMNAFRADQRTFDWSFCGSVSTSERSRCVSVLEGLTGGRLVKTNGYRQGLPRSEYYWIMSQSKMIPCPAGPANPESFRFSEALESGCIPICLDSPAGYWNWVLEDDHLPFPLLSDWGECSSSLMRFWTLRWREKSLECRAWWQLKKTSWVGQLKGDTKWP